MLNYMNWIIAAALVLAPVSGADAPQEHDTRDIRHKIADPYGVHQFNTVERISFTFNVKSGERGARRSWTWWPLEGRVRYEGGTWREEEGPYEYMTADANGATDEELIAVDQRFINDSYWLLFPLHVEWDVAATVTDEGMAPLPLGDGGEARKVVVAYPETGGYTPGDTYELYVGDDYRVLQWVFRPGDSPDESYPVTWEDEERFGAITIATNHLRPGQPDYRLWFTDISVEFR